MTSEVSQTDLTHCDREPIHIPASVQPHGVLLALGMPDLTITQVSQSAAEHLGRSSDQLLGRALAEVIDPDSARVVARALGQPRLSDENPLALRAARAIYDGILHRSQQTAILELEPQRERLDAAYGPLRFALADLEEADSLAALGQATVRAVRRLTGFERVMLYRFDEDEHGSVEAEAKDDQLEPYLGLHYPASDIPRQARALYLRNWLRIIPDARYKPSPIVPPLRPDTGMPLDLSGSVLRSVSPVHLEYLENMGVRASMSISLVVADRLWGLISCLHHSGPRFLRYETRAACEALGRLVSLQIAALEQRARHDQQRAREGTQRSLVDAMAGTPRDEDLLAGLGAAPDALLSLVHAEGAAILGTEHLQTCGRTPSEPLLAELAAWLDGHGDGRPFTTNALPRDLPACEPEKHVASGLLTIALPGTRPRRVIWFRPELVQTVRWGGDPRKTMELDPSTRLHPRRSFAQWKEEVRGRALSFSQAELDAAEELRRSAVELDLKRQLEQANSATQLRDDLIAVVSHDLRSPLSVVQLQAHLLLQTSLQRSDEPAHRLRASAERIQRAVDRMNSLVTDLLDLAKIEAGRFELSRRREALDEVVQEGLVIMRPLAEAKHITLVDPSPISCAVEVDRERIFQVFSNLVGNAIKFTPEGGQIRIETERSLHELSVRIIDTGPGIPESAMKHVFDRYWQASRAQRATGAGLGLYIARGIVEAHGGRIWVERAAGGGAQFTFTLTCVSDE